MFLTIENFLNKYNIKDKKVIVGFSAGPDSVALAFLLSNLAKKFNIELSHPRPSKANGAESQHH